MKVTFVYANGKTFTLRNIIDLDILNSGGNINRVVVNDIVHIEPPINLVKRLEGVTIKLEPMGDSVYQRTSIVSVDKADLHYLLLEDTLIKPDWMGELLEDVGYPLNNLPPNKGIQLINIKGAKYNSTDIIDALKLTFG